MRKRQVDDLVFSKLAAGRLKDLEFAAALLEHDLAQRSTLSRRIARLDFADDVHRVRSRLQVVLDDIRSARSWSKGRRRK